MARLRVPFSAAASQRLRLTLWTGMMTGLALFAGLTYVSTLAALRPATLAVPTALFVSLSAAAAWGFMVFSMTADYRLRPAWNLAASGLFGTSCGVMIMSLARESWHLPSPAAAAMAACAALASGVFCFLRTSRSAQRALGWFARRPADRRAAQDTYDASQSVLSSSRTSAEEEKTARLNRARAAIAWSRSDDAPDGLVLATTELEYLLANPPASWPELFGAAVDLFDAVSVRAAKHGDVGGYPKALQLLTATAARMPTDVGAMAVVHERQADYHVAMAGWLAPGHESDAHTHAAIAELRAAIATVTPFLRSMLPGLYATLGVRVARVRACPGDLEAGIEMCRTAIQLAGRRPQARARPERALATLLTDRAIETAEQLPPDAAPAQLVAAATAVDETLIEAERLLRHARRHGGFDSRVDVTDLLAQARSARAMILDGPGDDQRAVRAWRDAARAAARDDPLDRVRIGQNWVGWAESTQDVTWCAEAYAYLMSVVPPAVAVRYLVGERDRVLADLQFTAEEAGYWLAEAGRISDAAIALELGRAVSLSEVLGRERPDLPAALIQVRREDLLARYRAALEEYRAAAAPGPDQDLSSAAQRAWARYDATVRDIAAVVDIDVPGAPLRLAELTLAARDGPVVYLAGATRGGYAIVVPTAGPPVYRPLPGLARTGVAGQAESFLRGAGPVEVETVVQWLWDSGIRAMSRDLPAGALITIVPVGLLSLLPVHAAGGPTAAGQAPEDWEYLADLVTVRYAHNARTLLRARDRADKLPRSALTLLAVAAPDSDPQQQVRYTVPEITQIARQWARAETVIDGTPTAVERMLAGHTVWHFACHCHVTPDSILDSELLLTGARLSLRTILALPPSSRRLAVLSACDTHLSGTRLPDEAIGLPAGLLQAGFAGVVGSYWSVTDRSTAIFMIRFHELWYGQGFSPAVALARTQRWLRTATSAELTAYLGGGQGQPAHEPPAAHTPIRTAGRYGHPYFWAAFALTGQ